MASRRVTRRQVLTACGLMLAAGALAPQAIAACGGGPPPVANIHVAPGETAAIISFDTDSARDALLAIWSDDVPQSYQSFSPPLVATGHSFKILGLQPDTRYHYEIRLHDTPDASYIAFAADLRTRPRSGDAGQGVMGADDSEDAADGA